MGIQNYSRIIALNNKFQQEGVTRGMTGYVIEAYNNGMYEVEFSDQYGITIAIVVMSDQDISLHPESI